ncbi:MAG: glycosyltransferase family 4 protein [Egibacteraceae bacterium]
MRVGFVSRRFFPTISGMSVYAANLLRELVAAGHDVTMVSQYRNDPLGVRVYGGGPPPPVPGVRVLGRESRGEQQGGAFERDVADLVGVLRAEHRRQPFDVIHAQYAYPPGLAALQAGRELGVPVVVSVQGGDGHWVGSCCAHHEDAMRVVLGGADALLIGSRSFAGEVTARLGTPPGRWTIVPGGVDTQAFTPGTRSRREPPVLLYHGRIDARKGALDVVEAVAALAALRPVRLLLSGIGPDSDVVAARVRELGLGHKVELAGYVAYDDAPAVYRRGDVFVSPTYAEGFSNTILEAMASGLPVVSTRAVGVVDCLRDGHNGLLVDPGDVPALTGALRRLLDDPALGARLADTALREVRACYSWHAVAAQIVGVYERVVARPSAWADGSAIDTPVDEGCRFRAAPHLL